MEQLFEAEPLEAQQEFEDDPIEVFRGPLGQCEPLPGVAAKCRSRVLTLPGTWKEYLETVKKWVSTCVTSRTTQRGVPMRREKELLRDPETKLSLFDTWIEYRMRGGRRGRRVELHADFCRAPGGHRATKILFHLPNEQPFINELLEAYSVAEAEPETSWELDTEMGLGQEAGRGWLDELLEAPTTSADDRLFRKHARGFSRYGGGRLDTRLRELRGRGLLSITDADIDLLQRIANVETGGLVQSINSYDSAYMSMGFLQLTIKYNDKYNPDGKLQRLIKRAPQAFQKYGIELDAARRYRIPARGGTPYNPVAIKGAQHPQDLRSLEWAKRFYAAGLDPAIIVAQARLALEIIDETKRRLANRVGTGFLPHYERSVSLRALIQETFNNRPAYLVTALRNATALAGRTGGVTTERFLDALRKAIRQEYARREPTDGPHKAENLIRKTARPVIGR